MSTENLLTIGSAAGSLVLQILIAVANQHLYKVEKYVEKVEARTSDNESNMAAEIERFMRTQEGGAAYESGDDSGFRDVYLEFVKKMHRLTKLDLKLQNLYRVYLYADKVRLWTLILTTITLIGAVVLIGLKVSWALIAICVISAMLFLTYVTAIVAQHHKINKLNEIKQNGEI